MKKVLALVLAATMILGSAVMASAVTVGLKTDSTKFDYELYLYQAAGHHTVAGTTEFVGSVELEILINEYEHEYNHFIRALNGSVAELQDYLNLDRNICSIYVELLAQLQKEGYVATAKAATVGMSDAGFYYANFEAALRNALGMSATAAFKLSAAQVSALKTLVAKNVLPVPADVWKLATITKANDDYLVDNGGYIDYANKSYVDITDLGSASRWLYEYDAGSVTFGVYVKKGDTLRVDVDSGKVSVKKQFVETINILGRNDGYDLYKVTISSEAGVRDFDLSSWTVELDVNGVKEVYFIKGEVAYSDYRDVYAGDKLYVTGSDADDNLHEDGSIFKFYDYLTDEVRIICNDFVDVFLSGNYGTDIENFRVTTGTISEVKEFFGDVDLDYYNFVGTPKFAKDVTVRVDADSDAYIYEYDEATGDITDITDECDWTSYGFTFDRKILKAYIIAEEPYEGGNILGEDEPIEEPADDLAADGSKPNPGTGAYAL